MIVNTTQCWCSVVLVVLVGLAAGGCGGEGSEVVAGLDGALVGDWLMIAGEPPEPTQGGQEMGAANLSVSDDGTIRLEVACADQWAEGTVHGANGDGRVIWTNWSVIVSQMPEPPLNEPIAFSYVRSGWRLTLEYDPQVSGAQWSNQPETYVKLHKNSRHVLEGEWFVAPADGQQENWDSQSFEMVSMERNCTLALLSYVDGSLNSTVSGRWRVSQEDHLLWKLPEGYRQCTFQTDGGWATLHFADEDLNINKCQQEFPDELARSWAGRAAGQALHLYFGSEGSYLLRIDGETVQTGNARTCCYGPLLFDHDGQLRWAQYELRVPGMTITQWHGGVAEQWVLLAPPPDPPALP